MSYKISPFRKQLELAADSLMDLATRSSPMISTDLRRRATAVRHASSILEGNACEFCRGSGKVMDNQVLACAQCGGTGEL
jgi:RecJ-like exonuclease